MAGKDLRELFHETLKDIYFAEKKILGALPKMAKAANSRTEAGVRKSTRGSRRSTSIGSSRYLPNWMRPPGARRAMRSWASSRKAKR